MWHVGVSFVPEGVCERWSVGMVVSCMSGQCVTVAECVHMYPGVNVCLAVAECVRREGEGGGLRLCGCVNVSLSESV